MPTGCVKEHVFQTPVLYSLRYKNRLNGIPPRNYIVPKLQVLNTLPLKKFKTF